MNAPDRRATDHRKAVAHYAAQEDAARDYADALRYRWLRDHLRLVPNSDNKAVWFDITLTLPPIKELGIIDAAIDMELERAGRAT